MTAEYFVVVALSPFNWTCPDTSSSFACAGVLLPSNRVYDQIIWTCRGLEVSFPTGGLIQSLSDVPRSVVIGAAHTSLVRNYEQNECGGFHVRRAVGCGWFFILGTLLFR